MFRISRTTYYCGKNAGAYRGRECRAAGRRRFQGARPPAADGRAGAGRRPDLLLRGAQGRGADGICSRDQRATDGGWVVRPATEGTDERGLTATEGTDEWGPTGAREGAAQERSSRDSREGGARSGREVGGGGRTEDFRYIYQWQKRVIIWKFRVEVCNPRAQKLGKLLSRSFSTLGKK